MPETTPQDTTQQLPRHTVLAWRNAIFVIFALSGLSIATWAARLPAIRSNLDIGTDTIGLIILAMSGGSIIGLTQAPRILGALGIRRALAGTLLLVASGVAIIAIGSGIVASVPITIIGLIIFGFGNGALDVTMNVDGAAAETALGKTVLPLMHACFSLGTLAGAALGALAALLSVDVAPHLIGVAVVIALTAVTVVRFVPVRDVTPAAAPDANPSSGNLRHRLAERFSVWRDSRLLLIGVVMLGMAFAEGSANDWMTLAVVDGHHQEEAVGAAVFGIFVGAMFVARIVGGPLIDRFGRVIVLRVSAGLAAAGLLLFITVNIPAVFILGAILWGLGSALGFPVGMSAAADGPNPAARVGAVAMIGYIAFLVGPPGLGLLGEHIGLLPALTVVLALVALSGIAAPAARETGQRARAPRA